MEWIIRFHDQFDPEFETLPTETQNELLAHAKVLSEVGPTLGRPYVDTLKGSKHRNMKEMRFNADNGVWRVAFAFDPTQAAVLLVADNKSGVSEKRFYNVLIRRADERFDQHLAALRKQEK